MVADRSTPLRSEQHQYPPAASSSRSESVEQRPSNPGPGPGSISYVVHTETNGVSDLKLRVSRPESSSKQPLRPIYLRERVLTEQNEIVDSIVDAATGKVRWTIHRPTRGWYLYLRSPLLPSGTAISIRSGKADEQDPTASPLNFSVNTKIQIAALECVKPSISSGSNIRNWAEHDVSAPDPDHNETIQGLASRPGRQSETEEVQGVAVAATGREDRQSAPGGHARRRSGATSSGSYAKRSNRPSSALTSSPMIPEIDSGDPGPSQPTNDPLLSRLTTPSANSSSSSPSLSPGGDRPYSPTQPSNSTFSTSPLIPRMSTFLLTDSRNTKQGTATQSWGRWLHSILPSEIRPSLPLDADKSFSLYWTDPPGEPVKDGGVEIVRFEDQSGRWLWNSHTRGKLTLQLSAMQAVGLEEAFWITASLAYIQFLEDKDAYDAAREA